ncbi:MAG: MotA/TolQ/ExbB proton channel family protein [Deltaproteobacteria bacterium]|nr:MotA/TolQ/ExbB proton channel family protein [Deltaproteobacteria bacterium]
MNTSRASFLSAALGRLGRLTGGSRRPTHSPGEERGFDRMGLVKGFFLALVATAVIFEVFPMPLLEGKWVFGLFDNWVSQTILWLTLWSLFTVFFMWRAFRQEVAVRQAFQSKEVTALLAPGIYAKTLDAQLEELDRILGASVRGRYRDSVFFRRVTRMVHDARGMPGKDGLSGLLSYQGEIDLRKMESAYAIVNVFIWAIPILGFIGTVLGIADAVAEFSSFIQTAEGGAQFTTQMRTALGGVTSGLAVAFNTTFVALVLVIPVMLAASLLQRDEEELLMAAEEFCLGQVMPNLHLHPSAEPVAEAYNDHLERLVRLSQTWLGQMEPVVQGLTLKTQMLSSQMEGAQHLIKDFTDGLGDPRPPRSAADPSAE